MIVIIDYGMGNLHSVQKAFEKFSDDVLVSANPADLARADKIVLPGVGAFRDAIAELNKQGFSEAIKTAVDNGTALLGICLGFQLLFEESFENGHYKGLGILPGKIISFDEPLKDSGLKIPHMGWNRLILKKESTFFNGISDDDYVYFVHSYFLETSDQSIVAAQTDYGIDFPSIVIRNKVYATQFHPEKSQSVGLKLVENFATLPI